MDAHELMGSFDAKVWAAEFVETVRTQPDLPQDEDAMRGWFAGALMAGYVHHHP